MMIWFTDTSLGFNESIPHIFCFQAPISPAVCELITKILKKYFLLWLWFLWSQQVTILQLSCRDMCKIMICLNNHFSLRSNPHFLVFTKCESWAHTFFVKRILGTTDVLQMNDIWYHTVILIYILNVLKLKQQWFFPILYHDYLRQKYFWSILNFGFDWKYYVAVE